MMLQACGREVPEAQRRRCEAHMQRCPSSVLDRISADMCSWSQLVH
jgi:hypothetical protein